MVPAWHNRKLAYHSKFTEDLWGQTEVRVSIRKQKASMLAAQEDRGGKEYAVWCQREERVLHLVGFVCVGSTTSKQLHDFKIVH